MCCCFCICLPLLGPFLHIAAQRLHVLTVIQTSTGNRQEGRNASMFIHDPHIRSVLKAFWQQVRHSVKQQAKDTPGNPLHRYRNAKRYASYARGKSIHEYERVSLYEDCVASRLTNKQNVFCTKIKHESPRQNKTSCGNGFTPERSLRSKKLRNPAYHPSRLNRNARSKSATTRVCASAQPTCSNAPG